MCPESERPPQCFLEMGPRAEKPWDDKVTVIEIKPNQDLSKLGASAQDQKQKMDAFNDVKDGLQLQRLAYLKDAAAQFQQAADVATNKGGHGVLIWLEEVLNYDCPELAERACEADHAFDRFCKVAHHKAPKLEIIRLKVPIYAMAECGKYGLVDPWDLLNAEVEEESEGQGKSFPRLSYLRTGTDEDKKTHGRLFTTYDEFGTGLTTDEPKVKEDIGKFIKSRDRRGLCHGEDNPALPVNGCCAGR